MYMYMYVLPSSVWVVANYYSGCHVTCILNMLQSALIFIRIPAQCIKDKGRFESDELNAITSQDYGWRKGLSQVDMVTVKKLYNLGKAIIVIVMCKTRR